MHAMILPLINASVHPFSEEGYEVYKSIHDVSHSRSVVVSVLTCVILVPLVSNGLVLFTYHKYKCLRTLHDKLLIHLAILNITMLFGVPLYTSTILFPEEALTSKFLCLFHVSILWGGMLSSILLYLGLALERYICILHPIKHRKLKTRHIESWFIASVVIGHMFYMLPVMGWNNWDEHRICSRHVFSDGFTVVSETLIFLPLLANITVHIIVLNVARIQSKKISLLVGSVSERHHNPKFNKSYKAYVTVFVTAVLSTLCWTPQLILNLVIHRSSMDVLTQRTLIEASYVPVVINSALSPLIFGLRHRHFKCALYGVLFKHQHHCIH